MTPSVSEINNILNLIGAYGPTGFALVVLWLMFTRSPNPTTRPELDIVNELRDIKNSLKKIEDKMEKAKEDELSAAKLEILNLKSKLP